jgi:hypothetical protein
MKNFVRLLPVLFIGLVLIVLACKDDEDPTPEPASLTAMPFASGLRMPIGFSMDEKGQLWVTEAGSGTNDASLVLITPSGVKTTVATGFPSVVANGAIEGISRPLVKDGFLYLLHGVSGILYSGSVASFKSGDAPLPLSHFQSEDIGAYVRSLNLTNPPNSNLFDQIIGPDGHLYLVDAGANAIFKRDKTSKAVTKFAEIPNVAEGVESVPTGIVYDGSNFLVTNLSGFPFAPGNARIYKVSLNGTVSDYKTGFTNLTHLTLTKNNKPIVLQLADFGPTGFEGGSGKILNENKEVLFSGLTMATDLLRSGDREFYVLSYAEGTIQKLTY